jgi:hypothetical protein
LERVRREERDREGRREGGRKRDKWGKPVVRQRGKEGEKGKENK